ncbi:MAG TPA: MMPL family transporter [Stellaceae bacterium]|nr:MMPL family transporter [Stellaceae bacterium]
MLALLARLVEFSRARPLVVIALAAVLMVGAGYYAAGHLGVSTDPSQMIARNGKWKADSAAYDAAFPDTKNVTTIVLDGSSADAVADGTKALAAALARRTDLFRTVRQPDGGPFFDRWGLMFLDKAELGRVSDQVAEAEPLLGPLAADPTLHGLFGVLDQALGGIEMGEATGDRFAGPLDTFAKATQSVVDGHPKAVDWGSLMTGASARADQLRHFIEVQPELDYDLLEPGSPSSQAIRDIAASLKLPEQGVRVRLTGDVPLEDDEMAAVTQGAGTATSFTAVAVLIILLLGLRAPRLILAIALTVVVGLVVTAGFAAIAVGTLNLISIAFAVLFIGIGVDFGIQFAMRYRAELYEVTGGIAPADRRAANAEALSRTGRFIAGPLSVAALATSVGFFAFLPTDYRGVSELGLISGSSMLVALLANLTVLPALLALLQGRGKPEPAGFVWAAPIDRWLERHAWPVVVIAAIAGVAAAVSVPYLRFDADPLHLKDPNRESTKTALDLTSDKLASPYSIDVLAPDLKSAESLADRLSKLPEANMVLWLGSFVPEDQDAKLDILSQMQLFLGPVLDPGPAAPSSPEEEHKAVATFATHLAKFLTGAQGKSLGPGGPALLAALQSFQAMPGGGGVASLRQVLIGGLPGRLDTLRQAVQATKLTLDTIPADFRSGWVSADGEARVAIFPKGDMKDPVQLDHFVATIRAAAPNATGPPIAILEAGNTVSGAFRDASLTALAAITLVLAIVLRRVRDVALVLAPLVLAGLYAIGTCVAVGLALNYANVIAVPLLMGIGVAFDIYFAMAWRRSEGPVRLLETATARAVVFSACTTGTAFGSLALSHHAGTASMGILLVLTLFHVAMCTLIVQPALMTAVGRGKT